MAIKLTPREAIIRGIARAEERFHPNARTPSIHWPEAADKIIESLREEDIGFVMPLDPDEIEVL